VTKPISGRLRARPPGILFRLSLRKLDILAGAIFQDELKPAGGANTGKPQAVKKLKNGSDRQTR